MSTLLSARRFPLADAGDIPNHPRLPLLVYEQAFSEAPGESLASRIEATLRENGWTAAWRYGVYDFAHYHSTAHEFLGVFSGSATLRLGHTAGLTVTVKPGDVLVLPAGTGHQNRGSSEDFQVVGGYPAGQEADLIRAGEGDPDEVRRAIARVPLPKTDPVAGAGGPLVSAWQ